jgi:hypothetical protein
VTFGVTPAGSTLTFEPLASPGATPVSVYVSVGTTFAGSITINNNYSTETVLFTMVRNGTTYNFNSNSFVNKAAGWFTGAPAGKYYAL